MYAAFLPCGRTVANLRRRVVCGGLGRVGPDFLDLSAIPTSARCDGHSDADNRGPVGDGLLTIAKASSGGVRGSLGRKTALTGALEGYAPLTPAILTLSEPKRSDLLVLLRRSGIGFGGVGFVVLFKVSGEHLLLRLEGVIVADGRDRVGRAGEDRGNVGVFLSGVFLDGRGRGLCVLEGGAEIGLLAGEVSLLLVESRIFCVDGAAVVGIDLVPLLKHEGREIAAAEINPNKAILHLGQTSAVGVDLGDHAVAILCAHVSGVGVIARGLLRDVRGGERRPVLRRRGLLFRDRLKLNQPGGRYVFTVGWLDRFHSRKAAGGVLWHRDRGGPLICGLFRLNDGVGGQDHALGLSALRVLEAIPGLADKYDVRDLDGRGEHVRDAVSRSETVSVLAYEVPNVGTIGVTVERGALDIARRGFDGLRNGEPAELVQLPGVLGG